MVVSALRTIQSAQELYNSRYGTYGNFKQLDSANTIDSVLANATTPASSKGGYYYSLTLSPDRLGWSCVARPVNWGECACVEHNFFTNEMGAIYWNDLENGSEFTKEVGRD